MTDHPLGPLFNHDQFMLYMPDKTKTPLDYRTLYPGSIHNIQTDYATAYQAAGGYFGVGFVLREEDPFFFLDIDDCLQADGSWSPLAVELCRRLAGAAVEISLSGCGLHIIGTGRPPAGHKNKNTGLHIELYSRARFVALTGVGAVGSAGVDCTAALAEVCREYFNGEDDIIVRALQTQSAGVFAGRASFKALWTADETILGECYPHHSNAYDRSAADAALAQHLAYWTGKDAQAMRKYMFQSALVREKWDREDYIERTIQGAIERQETVFSLSKDPLEQCVYISRLNRVLTPTGDLLNKPRMDAFYGGRLYSLTERKNTIYAFDALVHGRVKAYPRAHDVCFRPDLPPRALVNIEGRTHVNTYTVIETDRMPGDASRFVEHMRKVLPHEGDQQIYMSYLAALVQHKGKKFQWAPLLQGAEGNGKTLFTSCVAHCLGWKYVHLPSAVHLGDRFNGWLYGKLLIGIEDIWVLRHKFDIIEKLKPMITGEAIEIQFKGADQITTPCTANFILNSNHKDGLIKTRDDRRYSVFLSAQQSFEEIKLWGMGGSYFPSLYDWLKNKGGYAIVHDYLATYPIPPALDPTIGCLRAPITSTQHEAILASEDYLTQAIREYIEEERYGFCGGYISSIQIGYLIKEHNLNIGYKKRKEVLFALDYIPHPALRNGRVDNSIAEGKPALWVHKLSVERNIKRPSQVAKRYEKAQKKGSLLYTV